MPAIFELQFHPSEIRALAARYDYGDDAAALDAGQRIATGDYNLTNLKRIISWKSPRSIGRAERNTEADVTDALRSAVSAKTDRAAVAVLIGLRGVDVPVASAILAAINPDRFTIIDYRALESLGVKRLSPTVDFYLEYLAHCRHLASKHGVSLRDLDRALWQWSKERRRVKQPA
jgi:hypothetical protein